MELEAQLEETKKEALSGGFGPREKKDPAEWIPRGPERVELHGHRSSITRILFHPQYNIIVTSSEDSQIKVNKFLKQSSEYSLLDLGFRIRRIRENPEGSYRYSSRHSIRQYW